MSRILLYFTLKRAKYSIFAQMVQAIIDENGKRWYSTERRIEVAGFISNLPDARKAVEGRRKGRPPKGNRFRKVYLGDAGNTGITVILHKMGRYQILKRYADSLCRLFISEKRFPKQNKSIGGKEKWQYLQEQV